MEVEVEESNRSMMNETCSQMEAGNDRKIQTEEKMSKRKKKK